jgi:hypothetical protein
MSNTQTFSSLAELQQALANGQINHQQFSQHLLTFVQMQQAQLNAAKTELQNEKEKSSPEAAFNRFLDANPPKPLVEYFTCDAEGCKGHNLPHEFTRKSTSGISFDGKLEPCGTSIKLERMVFWNLSLKDLSGMYNYVEAKIKTLACQNANILLNDFTYEDGKKGLNVYFGGKATIEKFKEAGAAKKAKKSLPSPADSAANTATANANTKTNTSTQMPPEEN